MIEYWCEQVQFNGPGQIGLVDADGDSLSAHMATVRFENIVQKSSEIEFVVLSETSIILIAHYGDSDPVDSISFRGSSGELEKLKNTILQYLFSEKSNHLHLVGVANQMGIANTATV